MSDTAKKRVLIVGAGKIAGLNELDPARRKPATHAGMVISTPGLELAGVVDVDAVAARRFADAFACNFFFDDLAAALSATEPDVATVAVPYRYQAAVVHRILDHPDRPACLVLEKPLSAKLADAKRLVAATKAAGIRILVNNEVAAPIYRDLENVIARQFAGEVISASAWCSSGMHAVGVHILGILCRLFGRPAWVRATAESEHVASLPFSSNFVPEDPRIHGMIVFERGTTAFLTNSALTGYTFKEIEITCRGGRLRLGDNGTSLSVWSPAVPGASTISYTLQPPVRIAADLGTAFSALGGYLASDDPDAGQDVVGADAALLVYRLLDALVVSARTGRDVELKPDGDEYGEGN